MKSEFLSPAPANYVWPQCPEADRFVQERIAQFLIGHSFAHHLSERMHIETSTEFQAWVDQVILSRKDFSDKDLARLGFVKDRTAKASAGTTIYWHPFADLPRILLVANSAAVSIAIMVESISDFQLAHSLSLPIEGAPLSLYRECRIPAMAGKPGKKGLPASCLASELRLIERRGTRSIIPDTKDRAGKYTEAVELWTNRPRKFSNQKDGMRHTLALAQKLVRSLGTGMAAWAFLEGERRYWMSRNRAAQVQKSRQDRLGLGWANHDHHTFRSSRPAFAGLIKILLTFGFKKRERYWAGAEAGWGAQVMEQPEARLIIFADVDLSPTEISVDFSKSPLPDLKKPGTVGLWCALHGESMLEAGMHHLEAKFDFEHLRVTLVNSGVSFMKPFSDFPHLRQAFSEGEWWRVPLARLEALKSSGKLSEEAFERIKQYGAVGSHMENLQRRNGFKGFNQRAVSQIIKEVNPETQALRNDQEHGA